MNWYKTGVTAFILMFLVLKVCGQDYSNIRDLNFEGQSNIEVQKLSSNEQSSSFCIQVKNQVKTHFHEWHSETIYVLAGEATMWINADTMKIKSGDFVNIPPKSHHGVLVHSKKPLKVLSVQAPEFHGKDRIFVTE